MLTIVALLLVSASGSEKQLLFSGSGRQPDQKYNQTYTIECDQHSDSECNSISLEEISVAMQENPASGHVTITIFATQLTLTENITFSKINYITISGNADLNTSIICQREFIGVIFDNITILTIQNLVVVNCGVIPTVGKFAYSSAVAIIHCKNVTAVNLTIAESVGIGLSILRHQGGIVQITSSKFLENQVSTSALQGGGGVYIGSFGQYPIENITFRFINCVFQENIAHTRYYDFIFTDDFGEPVDGYGLGGGAAMLFEGNLGDVHAIFSKCVFKRNVAFLGSGLVLRIKEIPDSETSNNIHVRVEHCLFEENGVSLMPNTTAAGGGGLLINLKGINPNGKHSITVDNSTFKGNVARFGGGLYFFSDVDSYKSTVKQTNIIIIERCNFDSNTAHTGAAVDITPNIFQRVQTGVLTTPLFRECNFSNNYNKLNSQAKSTQATLGIGTIYVSLYDISFQGYNRFENNSGTAIHVFNGNIDMSQGSAYIYNNSGIQGGGITLIGQSSMIVGPNQSYDFINNTAFGKGGGLYVELNNNHDITASKTCFIQYSKADSHTIPVANWTAKIKFSGNTAKNGRGGGNAIFATSLYPCQTINTNTAEEPKYESIDAIEVFKVRGVEFDDDLSSDLSPVATEGAVLHSSMRDLPIIEVIPGETFEHGVYITDDLNHTTKFVLIASVPDNDSVAIDPAFSCCVGKHLALNGEQNVNTTLTLRTMTSRMSYIKLKVSLTDCPPGFKFSDETKSPKCVCNYQEYDGFVKCDTLFHGYITTGFWVGLIADSHDTSKRELVTSYCPLNFCDYNGTDTTGSAVRLPQSKYDLDTAMCGKYRTGISCGQCAKGYTTYYHSPNYACLPVKPILCKLGWLFYILSELVPVTLVFITVLALNISFTSGVVNGFIFFSQVLNFIYLDASGFIVFSPAMSTLARGYQIIYGFFNLNILEISSLSFCLLPNASPMDILAFKYITIIYALFLVIIVIWLMNKCHRITRFFSKYFRITTVKTSITHGLSAFLVLCYSQSLRVSLHLLRGYHPAVREGSDLNVSKRVWLNGNLIYFGRGHLVYAIPALFFLFTLGVLPLIVLLAYPQLNRILAFCNVEESRIITFIGSKLPISSIKPLIDTFQGSFKDNLRFFAGLYFLYRFILLLFDVFLLLFSQFYTATEALFITIALLHAIFQPYAQKWHNVIDALLFADLALINIITFSNYFIFRTSVGRQVAMDLITHLVSIQLILIYLPFFIMIVYILTLICSFMCSKKCAWIEQLQKIKSITVSESIRKLKELVQSNDREESESLPHEMIVGEISYERFED